MIDVPSGRVVARVTCAGGRRHERLVSQRRVLRRRAAISSWRPAGATVAVSISYGGALYASVSAAALGLAVTPDQLTELIQVGREIKWALNDSEWARHPSDPRLDGIYGTILFDDLGDDRDGPRQRNVTVFADGEVDRSPVRFGHVGAPWRCWPTRAGWRLARRPAARVDRRHRLRRSQSWNDDGRTGAPAYLTEVEGNAYETGTGAVHPRPADAARRRVRAALTGSRCGLGQATRGKVARPPLRADLGLPGRTAVRRPDGEAAAPARARAEPSRRAARAGRDRLQAGTGRRIGSPGSAPASIEPSTCRPS